jgi:hypothetical protein
MNRNQVRDLFAVAQEKPNNLPHHICYLFVIYFLFENHLLIKQCRSVRFIASLGWSYHVNIPKAIRVKLI